MQLPCSKGRPLSLSLSQEMDIIHGVSNLEMETKHSSSSQEEVEEEVKRNWLDLPPDVMSLILLKLGAVNILVSAQWVCSSWWKLSKQPHLFRSIHAEQVFTLFGRRVRRHSTFALWEGLAREAISRSCGQLVEFSVRVIANDGLLRYISEKSSSLRCLRLVYCDVVTGYGLIEVCKQFPQLEDLEVCGCSFSESVFRTIGCLCPHLKSFRLNYLWYFRPHMLDGIALVIAETMPELQHLNLFEDSMTDDGLRAILNGCPHLQSLDLRQCFNLKFEGDLKRMSANIKLRLPYDSTHDIEYSIDHYVDNFFYPPDEEE